MSYSVSFHEDAARDIEALDSSIRNRIIKRIARMREEPPGRHFERGLDYFVIEAGQYRIVYVCERTEKIIYFVGKHKNYEKWYSGKR